jgi:hypothetical protein
VVPNHNTALFVVDTRGSGYVDEELLVLVPIVAFVCYIESHDDAAYEHRATPIAAVGRISECGHVIVYDTDRDWWWSEDETELIAEGHAFDSMIKYMNTILKSRQDESAE